MRRFLSPYPPREFFSMVWRRFTPPSPSTLQNIDLQLTEASPDRWIGFVGDVCPLFGRSVQYSRRVRAFFSPCHTMVGNFEGVLTDRAWRPFRMKHSPSIFSALEELRPLEKWVLSVANNHGADYGADELFRTVEAMEARRIRWLGTPERPHVSLGDGVTLSAWTWWSNFRTKAVLQQDPGPPSRSGLHIAFPHWGYEHERVPRPTQTPPSRYPLVVGHHSHLPQPFVTRPDGQLVAWSLGNFVTGKRLPTLGEGAVLRLGLVSRPGGETVIGRASFRPIVLDRTAESCRVRLARE